MVFRPFKGEVIFARINDSSAAGIQRTSHRILTCLAYTWNLMTDTPTVRTDFFYDIFVPCDELPEEARLQEHTPHLVERESQLTLSTVT